jgi:DNA-binding NarL/FixJ family response regulator
MNDRMKPRILLCDADADVRQALALLLHTALGLQIIGEATDLASLLVHSLVETDILFIDWSRIASSPRQLLAQFRHSNTTLQIAVLSTRVEVRADALAAGADAFISKGDPPERVLATIHQLLVARNANK